MVVNTEMQNGLYPLRSTPFRSFVAQSAYLLPPPFRYTLFRYTPFGSSVAQSSYLLPPPLRFTLFRYTRPP